jgi:diaminopimelate decarboxylase
MSSNFNSRLKPAEVLVKDGKSHLIRKADVFEDLLKNQIEVIHKETPKEDLARI